MEERAYGQDTVALSLGEISIPASTDSRRGRLPVIEAINVAQTSRDSSAIRKWSYSNDLLSEIAPTPTGKDDTCLLLAPIWIQQAGRMHLHAAVFAMNTEYNHRIYHRTTASCWTFMHEFGTHSTTRHPNEQQFQFLLSRFSFFSFFVLYFSFFPLSFPLYFLLSFFPFSTIEKVRCLKRRRLLLWHFVFILGLKYQMICFTQSHAY
jgi:hypothetical protein